MWYLQRGVDWTHMQVRLSDVSGNQIWIKFSCVVFILHADFRVNVTIRQLNLHFQGTYFGKTALRRRFYYPCPRPKGFTSVDTFWLCLNAFDGTTVMIANHCDDCKPRNEGNFSHGGEEWNANFTRFTPACFSRLKYIARKMVSSFIPDPKIKLLTITFHETTSRFLPCTLPEKKCQKKLDSVISAFSLPIFRNRIPTTASFLRVVVFALCTYFWELV